MEKLPSSPAIRFRRGDTPCPAPAPTASTSSTTPSATAAPAAPAGDGPRRADDPLGGGLLRALADRGCTSCASTTATSGSRRSSIAAGVPNVLRGDAEGGRRRTAGRGALHARRHGGRHGRRARRARRRERARRRRVDGRHDRADDGRSASAARAQPHLDHVDDRRSADCRRAKPEAMAVLLAPPSPSARHGDRAAASRRGARSAAPASRSTRRTCASSSALPTTAASIRRARRASSRDHARTAAGARARAPVKVPTLVIHGAADPLVPIEARARHGRRDPGRGAARDRGHGPRPAARALAAARRRDRDAHRARGETGGIARLLGREMVEAAGIEPASARLPANASTCVAPARCRPDSSRWRESPGPARCGSRLRLRPSGAPETSLLMTPATR